MKWILIFSLTAHSVFADDKKTEKQAEASKIKAPMMTIQYTGGTQEFNSPKIMNAPYSRHIEFTSKGKKYIRDCKIGDKAPQHWVCTSPCSGGELKVMFERRKGFDVLQVPAFKIQPSMCDQNSRPDDPWIETKKEMVFPMKKLGTR